MNSSVSERLGRWISSKSRRGDKFLLSQKNIYIFPTREGFGFLFLLLLMLLTAINYQNSLIYLLTFFLGAVFFISIWMCFLNVVALEILKGETQGFFEGQMAYFQVRLNKASQSVFGLKMGLSSDKLEFVSVGKNEIVSHSLGVGGLKRGMHRMDRLRLESRFPFGLIQAWTWLKLDANVLIYPKPIECQAFSAEQSSTHGSKTLHKSQDFNGFKSFQEGDSLRRVNWKKYATSDQLFVRENDDAHHNPGWIRWQDYVGFGKEDRLQFMCYQVCRLHRDKQIFGLDLPSGLIAPSAGEPHYLACLEALARY